MYFFKKRQQKSSVLQTLDKLPSHIGIILDGNGRWAQRRGLARPAGHTSGASTFKTIVRYCSDIGIKYLTAYAFSTENWSRPQDEVTALMSLLQSYLEEAIKDFKNDSIIVKFIGDTTRLNSKLRQLIREAEDGSKSRVGMILNIALNYGSRNEIVYAVKNIAKKVINGEIGTDKINEALIAENLYTAGQPDPDFIIRTGGEFRLSNFLLWQSAYAEYIISDKLWPDFKPSDIDECILEFSKRSRRFGGI